MFCGESSEELREIFDQEDREINGFNDITGYEDFAVTRRFEDIEDLPEEISVCWNEVLVLCSNTSLLKECLRVVKEWLEVNSAYEMEITIVNFSEEDYLIYQTVAAEE